MIGSYSLGVRSIPGEVVKMCFDGGALSYGSQRIFWKGKWTWVGWVPQITIEHPPPQ